MKYFILGQGHLERGKKYMKYGKGPKLCCCTMFHNFLSTGRVLGSERVKLRSQGFFPVVFLCSFPPHQCGIVVCCPVPWFMCRIVAVRWVELFVSCCTRCAVKCQCVCDGLLFIWSCSAISTVPVVRLNSVGVGKWTVQSSCNPLIVFEYNKIK